MYLCNKEKWGPKKSAVAHVAVYNGLDGSWQCRSVMLTHNDMLGTLRTGGSNSSD